VRVALLLFVSCLNASVSILPERRARDHLRAIHALALCTHHPHYAITGAADGDLRVWVCLIYVSLYITGLFSSLKSRPSSSSPPHKHLLKPSRYTGPARLPAFNQPGALAVCSS
jgi:hypothetical protein